MTLNCAPAAWTSALFSNIRNYPIISDTLIEPQALSRILQTAPKEVRQTESEEFGTTSDEPRIARYLGLNGEHADLAQPIVVGQYLDKEVLDAEAPLLR